MFKPFELTDRVMPNADASEEDIVATKSALEATGDYRVPSWGRTPWPDQPMFDGLKSLQRREGLEVDGWMRPGGPTARTINARQFESSSEGKRAPEGFRLGGSVGRGGANRAGDVAATQTALADIGLYPKAKVGKSVASAEEDADLAFGLSAFERNYKLPSRGRIDAGDQAARKLSFLARPAAAARAMANPVRGGVNPTAARAPAPPPPPARPAASKPPATPAPVKPASAAPKPQPPKKFPTSHQHKALNPADFDEPAFGGWSPGGAETRKKQRVMPIPAYRNQVINKEDWVEAHRAAESLGLGEGETRAFLEILAGEGGTARDQHGTAVGGIMKGVLLKHGPQVGIAKTDPGNLTMEERFKVYRSFLNKDDYFGKRGGTAYLNTLGDPEVAAAVADAMFEGGSGVTPQSVQLAANQSAINPVVVSEGFGPKTDSVLREAIRNPVARRVFLDALARRRVIDTGRQDARFEHFRFLR